MGTTTRARPLPLPAGALARTVRPSSLGFRTTAELDDSDEIVGQDRALEAIRLAAGIKSPGFNVFALGPPGIGKMTTLRQLLGARAAGEPVPDDWCYVNDFDDPQRPDALRLPAGRGVELREAMTQFILDLRVAIVALFEAESYRARKEQLESEIEKRRDAAMAELERRAEAAGIALNQTPLGFAAAPVRSGKMLEPDEFNALPEMDRKRYHEDVQRFGEELQALMHEVPYWLRELRRKINELDREVTSRTVHRLVDEVRNRFADLPAVLGYLDDVELDVVSRAQELRAAAIAAGEPETRTHRGIGSASSGNETAKASGEGGLYAEGDASSEDGPQSSASVGRQAVQRQAAPMVVPAQPDEGAGFAAVTAAIDPYRRYCVNVLVDNSRTSGAPFVVEDHPTQPNLVGRVEHLAQMGTLVTDFTLIRAGAFHRANGGYLIIEAEKLLVQPYAWEQLKRTLKSGHITIESPAQSLGLITTTALEPEPIPVDVKVALTGDRRIYYLLCAFDPDFLEHFKIEADFEETVDRTTESSFAYARLIGVLARREGLAPLDAAAVARAIDELARMASDNVKLSTHVGRLVDLLREADHGAREAGHGAIGANDVQAAIDARTRRAARIYERTQEGIARGIVNIRTDGSEVGQVNALSVIQLGNSAFGHPSRVTASVRLGRGEVVDIEREVELGGPIHSKGVLILSGFLGERFGGADAPGSPLSLTASLVFEQSYGGVDGDSASLAEWCALLSAISRVPLRQDIAVTGSIDQAGRVQAVGGVNEKIEGFFDAAQGRAGFGDGGVIIPAANIDHLMLSGRVLEAARQKRFRVWPVTHADQAVALLTGRRAGTRGRRGRYPAGSVNAAVEAALESMAMANRSAREKMLESMVAPKS